TDEVIQEAAILEERGIVRMCEKADLAIGKDNAAQQIVVQVTFDCQTERFLDQTAPCLTNEITLFKLLGDFFFGAKRTEHHVPDSIGEDVRESIKLFYFLQFVLIRRVVV